MRMMAPRMLESVEKNMRSESGGTMSQSRFLGRVKVVTSKHVINRVDIWKTMSDSPMVAGMCAYLWRSGS